MMNNVHYTKNRFHNFFLCLILACFFSCTNNIQNDFLVKIYKGEHDELGVPCAYISNNGDTIIPFGKYHYCYTDTLKNYAIVLKMDSKCIAIDKNEKELFEVFWFDNGPDYIKDGLFRIVDNDKIGYANIEGQIVIEPQYECAFPFENGKAKVTYKGLIRKDGEHSLCQSSEWFYIDKKGIKVE